MSKEIETLYIALVVSGIINFITIVLLFSPNACKVIHSKYLEWKK